VPDLASRPGSRAESADDPPDSPAPRAARSRAARAGGALALTAGAIGVVFGDIGTSPLYALHAVFAAGVRPDQTGVYGVVSLVFWALTIIVSLKYVTFILRADNDGEGGIMALIAQVQSISLRGRTAKLALVALGIFGASLFYGDGMITPAISVLSAVEGLKVAAPGLESLVIEITLVILAALFVIQRFGTGAVGRLFGPVMTVWFAILAVAGVAHVVRDPAILRAIAPTYAVGFLVEHSGVAVAALGAVVLTVTGAEALFADMGHFGRGPIRRAWGFLVFPALILQYMGQGALVLRSPGAVANPFYLLFPHWARVPMVVLATMATVIASQAVISGAFSVTRQAVRLGFLPRLTILHTSRHEPGQVYVPAVNWALFAAVVALVVGFGSAEALASAYGIAVTGTLAIDTVLFFVVVRMLWKKPLWLVLAGAAGFLLVDLTFLGANLPKVRHGGWFPLLVAVLIFVVLTTWHRGRDIVTRNRTALEGPLCDFVAQVHEMDPPPYRPPHTGVFLNANLETTPLALRACLEHNRSVHESVVIVSVETLRVPYVSEDDRVAADDLGYRDDGITHVTLRYGFQDAIDVPRALRRVAGRLEGNADLEDVSYFISRMTIVPTGAPGMRRWRKRLFTAIARNAANPLPYFGLPDDRTVVMGSHVEL
jgi:KUP system potassium uptake protein